MTAVEKEVNEWLQAKLDRGLENNGRDRVYEALDQWLSFTARKKPVPDLDVRLTDFRKRLRALADNFTVETSLDGYVVRATGDAESTMRRLELGTFWFDPVDNLTALIVGAVFERT